MGGARSDASASRSGQSDPRADRSRAAPLDSARQLLIDEGWDAVTQVRVAAHAGLGRAPIYRHWPHTADLLLDVIEAEIPSVQVESTDDLRRDLTAMLKAIRAQLTDQGLARVLATLVDRAEWDEDLRRHKAGIVAAATETLRNRLRRAVADGEIDRGANLERAVDQLVGPLVYRRLISEASTGAGWLSGLIDDFLR